MPKHVTGSREASFGQAARYALLASFSEEVMSGFL